MKSFFEAPIHHCKAISISQAVTEVTEVTENIVGNKSQVTIVFIRMSARCPDSQPSLGFHRHNILYLVALHESSLSGGFTDHILCLSAAKYFEDFGGNYHNFSDQWKDVITGLHLQTSVQKYWSVIVPRYVIWLGPVIFFAGHNFQDLALGRAT